MPPSQGLGGSNVGNFTGMLGFTLLRKGIVSEEQMLQCLRIHEAQQGRRRRNIAQILVMDLGFNHDQIFHELALLAKFREIRISAAGMDPGIPDLVQPMLLLLHDRALEMAEELQLLPYGFDEKHDGKFLFVTTDPTQPALSGLIREFRRAQYEICLCSKEDFRTLWHAVVPPLRLDAPMESKRQDASPRAADDHAGKEYIERFGEFLVKERIVEPALMDTSITRFFDFQSNVFTWLASEPKEVVPPSIEPDEVQFIRMSV